MAMLFDDDRRPVPKGPSEPVHPAKVYDDNPLPKLDSSSEPPHGSPPDTGLLRELADSGSLLNTGLLIPARLDRTSRRMFSAWQEMAGEEGTPSGYARCARCGEPRWIRLDRKGGNH